VQGTSPFCVAATELACIKVTLQRGTEEEIKIGHMPFLLYALHEENNKRVDG
jgi:hypothetical protein